MSKSGLQLFSRLWAPPPPLAKWVGGLASRVCPTSCLFWPPRAGPRPRIRKKSPGQVWEGGGKGLGPPANRWMVGIWALSLSKAPCRPPSGGPQGERTHPLLPPITYHVHAPSAPLSPTKAPRSIPSPHTDPSVLNASPNFRSSPALCSQFDPLFGFGHIISAGRFIFTNQKIKCCIPTHVTNLDCTFFTE